MCVCPHVFLSGMGFNATLHALRFLKRGGVRHVCDPFCGKGSVLAVANYIGMDATGVEIATSRARQAAALQVTEVVGFSAKAWLAGKDKTKPKDAAPETGNGVHKEAPQLDELFGEEPL